MTAAFQFANGVLYQGDVLAVLRSLPDQSAHCCVTSPPYFGLRDYGVEGQIGLEATPEEYISRLMGVFIEVRRVLRDDGTVWLNIGDSYAGSGKGGNYLKGKQASNRGSQSIGSLYTSNLISRKNRIKTVFQQAGSVKKKDLIGISWMLAFALREEGWYLRQDIIWSKPNPMPESVTDRCTRSHEHIFLMSKKSRYYFDQKEILEPISTATVARLRQDIANQNGSNRVPGKTNGPMKAVSRSGNKEHKDATRRGRPSGSGSNLCGSIPWEGAMRNKRDVWIVTTRPYKGAHFATFPHDLIRPCILAGCPERGVVIDPFFGTGTVGEVAQKFGRKWVGIELVPEYCELARERIGDCSRDSYECPSGDRGLHD